MESVLQLVPIARTSKTTNYPVLCFGQMKNIIFFRLGIGHFCSRKIAVYQLRLLTHSHLKQGVCV